MNEKSVSEEAKKWLEQAEADLKKAEALFEKRLFDGTAFYCQQIIEKSLKAVIIKKSDIFAKTHDLMSLGKIAGLPDSIVFKIKTMTGIYIESRYGFIGEEIPAKKFKEKDVSEFLKIGKEVFEWAKKMI